MCVCHCKTIDDRFKHFIIVHVIAESRTFFRRNAQKFLHGSNARAFARAQSSYISPFVGGKDDLHWVIKRRKERINIYRRIFRRVTEGNFQRLVVNFFPRVDDCITRRKFFQPFCEVRAILFGEDIIFLPAQDAQNIVNRLSISQNFYRRVALNRLAENSFALVSCQSAVIRQEQKILSVFREHF